MTNEIDRDVAALAAAIRTQARGRGMTYAQVAERAGIPEKTFDTYVSKTKPVDIKFSRVRAIAQALDMTVQELQDQADYWYKQSLDADSV
jgi:DNA-binding phage protein